MPNIKLHTPVEKQQIRAIIERRCPDLDIGPFGAGISASSSPWVAAMINVSRKGKIVSVAPAPANLKMFLLFALIAVTGIGILLYAVLALPKQQKVVKRVAAALSEELPVTSAAGAPGPSGAL